MYFYLVLCTLLFEVICLDAFILSMHVLYLVLMFCTSHLVFDTLCQSIILCFDT